MDNLAGNTLDARVSGSHHWEMAPGGCSPPDAAAKAQPGLSELKET